MKMPEKARIKKEQGPLDWVPCLFRGIVRGKRFMIEGGLDAFFGFGVSFLKPRNK